MKSNKKEELSKFLQKIKKNLEFKSKLICKNATKI